MEKDGDSVFVSVAVNSSVGESLMVYVGVKEKDLEYDSDASSELVVLGVLEMDSESVSVASFERVIDVVLVRSSVCVTVSD